MCIEVIKDYPGLMLMPLALGLIGTAAVLGGITFLVLGILGVPPIQIISMTTFQWQGCFVGAASLFAPVVCLLGGVYVVFKFIKDSELAK